MPFYTSRCAVCQTTNKRRKQKVCDECSFINEFVTKWGRENLRVILTNYLLQNNTNTVKNFKMDSSESVINDSSHTIRRSNTNSTNFHNCSEPKCSCHSRKNSNNFQNPCAPPYNP